MAAHFKSCEMCIRDSRTIVSVNKLMTNFRQYPKRYVNVSVFGKKDKGPADSPADTTLKY